MIDFRSVDTLEAALAALAADGADARVLAGGTDLVLQTRRGETSPGRIVHIGTIAPLREISEGEGAVRIGALVTHTALRAHPMVADRFPALREGAATVGGWQTQAVGTLGGNVCNASPAADMMPPLLVADAQVRLESTRGQRSMPVDAFVRGRRETAREADELLTGFELPLPPPRTGEVYLKVAPRRAMEVALVGLAVRLTLGPDDAIADARIAVCSVGPRPFRARAAERVLIAEGDVSGRAGEALAEQARPIDDARASGAYRRRILPGLLARAVGIARDRALAG